MNKRFAPLLLAGLMTVWFAPNALAQTPTQQPDLAPDKFYLVPKTPNAVRRNAIVLEMKPGDSGTEEFIIKNGGFIEKKFVLYVTDREVDQNKQYVFLDQAEDRKMAKYSILESSEVTLKSDEEKTLKVTFNIPKDMPLGTYHGAIAAVNTKPSTNNPNINIAVRFLMDIDLKVTDNPQPVPKLGEGKPQPTWYFYGSMGLFLGSMGYYLYHKKKEHHAKKHGKEAHSA